MSLEIISRFGGGILLWEQDTGIGRISISDEVVASLAGHAAIEPDGVMGLTAGRFKDGLANIVGRENPGRGVEVKLIDGCLVISVNLVILYGEEISGLARSVKKRVKEEIENSTGIPVSAVNINIQGVRVVADSG